MSSTPEGWEPRHVEALDAWRRGDVERLIKLCEREITIEASNHVRAFRATSDELYQADLNEASLRNEGGVKADFDDLCQVGREAVWQCYERYDPTKRTPFPAFARKRIRYAMKDALQEIQNRGQRLNKGQDDSSMGFTAQLETALEMIQRRERDESCFVDALDSALAHIDTQELCDAGDDMTSDAATWLRSYLWSNKEELQQQVGEAKYWSILTHVNVKCLSTGWGVLGS